MLTTLTNIEKGRAQQIIAQMIKEFLPHAFPDTEVMRDELYAPALNEVLVTLGLGNQTVDDKAATKVLAFLNNEMNNLSIDDEGKSRAKNRLGKNRVGLHIEPYTFEDIGISRSEVIEAVENPDKYTHLLRGEAVEESKATLSLFVKAGECNGEAASLLVEVVRHEDVLAVSAAFRIFMNDIEGSEDDSALVLLKKFVDTYGIDSKVGNSPWRKLHPYVAVQFNKSDPVSYADMAGLIRYRSDRQNDEVIVFQQIRVSELKVVEVAALYAISMSTYCDALRGHGLVIKKYS